ncbi:hypothetical protein [Rhizobium binae]|uniref:hypothetical protein n=1 Tax=Rhizobium binae TaxID=1138190 RepID=UPI001C837A6F|nr:hypothetical protein [Rhizobium binae]MBX4941150.1 hypothetical protein [Rhizobium binae]
MILDDDFEAKIEAELARTAPMRKRAEAYYLAANWHDKNAADCEAISRDEPRIGKEMREKARAAAVHHKASAAGLRLAATNILRANRPTAAP